MAILKPSNISPTSAQDASKSITFSWQNLGDRQYYYQIQIYNNSTSELAYDSTKIASLNAFYILPESILINGTTYKYQITVWNQLEEFVSSVWMVFKCSSAPIVNFTNLNLGSEILNSSYLFQGVYSQAEDIPIRSWNMILYDINDYIIGTTGVQYSDVIEYEFSGLNNEANYQVELQVRSQDDLIATTGKIPFYCRYEVPASTITLQAENVAEKAATRLSWRVTQIIGNVLQGEISYIDGEKIDLTSGIISFQEGLPNFRDFSLKLWIDWVDLKNDIVIYPADTFLGIIDISVRESVTEILRLKSSIGDIWVEWEYENESDGRFHIYKNFYGIIYHLYTPIMNPISGNNVFLGIDFNGKLVNVNSTILM